MPNTKRGCGHRTAGCCRDCGLCFACCVCERVAKVIFRIAARVQKRDKWFIGGYLGHVMEAWDKHRDARR